MSNHDLDSAKTYEELDPQGMFRYLSEMPTQCRRAWDLAGSFSLPPDYKEINKVVILGMGGSAIGADLVASLATAEARAPVIVVRDYALPAYVDAQTLVIANSYSGNTEETLSAFGQALKSDCKKLAITTGGKLAKAAGLTGIPLFTFEYAAQPRAAICYSLLPLLRFLQNLGIINEKTADVAEAAAVLGKVTEELKPDVPASRNAAKQLAQRLYGKLPVIYGAQVLAEVARRWKTQLNENSKAWAFHEVFPELNHNAVVGYQFPPELAARLHVIMLRSASLNPRLGLRQDITGELLQRAGVPFDIIDARGKRALAQMLSLVLFGDYVSGYLAMLYGVDPTPVAVIDYLKKRLAGE